MQAEERLAKRRAQAAEPAGDASEEDEAEVSSYNRDRGQILEVRCKTMLWPDVAVPAAVPANEGSAGKHQDQLVRNHAWDDCTATDDVQSTTG